MPVYEIYDYVTMLLMNKFENENDIMNFIYFNNDKKLFVDENDMIIKED